MHYVSLIVEFLRGRPSLVFWCVALSQAALWTLTPGLFYSAPPGEVPLLLAIGHEFVLGSYEGPPLAFWAGEIAFSLGGAFGLYLLAQACIVLAYWAVFTLGRAIVGPRHAALAVLLMVGIAAFTVPTPEFGPAIMAAPFWALALLHYWRAVGEGRRGAWFLLAIDLGLLLLASYAGIILVALMVLFTPLSARGRRALSRPEPWIACALLVIIVLPHALWLYQNGQLVLSGMEDGTPLGGLSPGLRLIVALFGAHLGFALLLVLASGWPRKRRELAPEIGRQPVEPLARIFVYAFAGLPAFAAVAIALAMHKLGPLDRITPLVVLSGLAVIVAAGDRVLLYRERITSSVWFALLLAPPLLIIAALAVLPWVAGLDLRVAQPANAEGAFFSDSYQRRTGKPLEYVTGDPRVAPLVALGAASRPHLYFAWNGERSPWASIADLRAKGGVIVWVAGETGAAPPAELKAQFPEMVPEVPHAFARPVQGILPLIRLGWAVIRPQAP